jgi:nicotinamidase-related amidase
MDRAFGLDIPEKLEDLCTRSRTALLIYDMQVGVVSQVRDGNVTVERIARLLRSARAAGIRVLYSRHYFMPTEWAGVAQLRMAKTWQRVQHAAEVKPLLLQGSPGFQVVDALAPQPGDAVIDKITMSAFEGTPLPVLLRDLGLVSFLVAGIALEIGIEPTVRHGADLGFIPVVVQDACGFGNAEAAQRSLAAMQFTGDAIFTDVARLCAILEATAGGS